MRRSRGVRRVDRAVVIALLAALLPSTPAASVGEGEPAGPRNRLAGESSPYLLLHADDPVAWYPWGAEAFERARAEGRPVFLSIGYSACYWCHVMEREVFSDPEIAVLMNRWFVNVKVDREERPDVDEIYITASQLLTGNAGWPASLFLTPELEPFFAGSYFPPEDGDGKAGFPTVLRRVHDAWTGERRAELEAAAERLTAAVRDALSERDAPAAAVPPAGAAEAVLEALARGYDETWGGFARPPAYRPKFPRPGDLFLLLEAWDRGDEAAGRRLVETLRAMGRGAIHDQLEGGFHRYTLDRAWRVPHFEKMLHDNALLGELLAEVSARGSDPELRHLARATLDFLLEQMALPGGGFVSSFDAETAAGEGAYYTWTKEEVREVLGEEGAALLAPVYGLDDDGELEGGRHTLYRSTAPEEALRARLAPHLAKLLAARQRRPAPQVDDKVLTDWNGMAVAALARGAAVFDEPRYLEAARAAAASLLDRVGPGDGEDDAGTLRHAWRAGEAKIPAFLDDYAFLVDGLLTLAEAEDHLGAAADPGSETGPGAAGRPSRRWIDAAETLAAELEARLRAPGGGYYLAAPEPHLPFQTRSITGGALPAGNAVAILALLELAERTGEPAYRERAAAALRAFAPALERYPSAVPGLARALLRFHAPESAAAEPGGAPVR